jgi:hypothetical protein
MSMHVGMPIHWLNGMAVHLGTVGILANGGAWVDIGIVEVGMKELLVCRSHSEAGELNSNAKLLECGKMLMFGLGFGAMSVLAVYM